MNKKTYRKYFWYFVLAYLTLFYAVSELLFWLVEFIDRPAFLIFSMALVLLMLGIIGFLMLDWLVD